MKVQQVYENEDAVLSEEAAVIASKMKVSNQQLPFVVDENRLIFEAYTVGSIQVLDEVINILPRNSVFTLSTVFEMILYNNNIIVNSENSAGYDYIDTNGVSVIPFYFYDACKRLVDFGLTGGYVKKYQVSDILSGDLILEKFNSNIIKVEGLHYINQFYTLNIETNQIIRSALNKIVKSNQVGNNSQKFFSLLREFDSVDEYVGIINDFEVHNKSFYSCNPYYPEVIQIALTILRDIKLSFANGSIQWYSFLQNSNNLFEIYIRKMVSKVAGMKIEKWDTPQVYATINYGDNNGTKSYTPDILVGYDEATNKCRVVLDVKNKKFNPHESNISELVAAADMYQLLFYCKMLKTNLGGLIYPAGEDYDPVDVIVNEEADMRVVLFSVNMKKSYRHRIEKLKKDLVKKLFKYL